MRRSRFFSAGERVGVAVSGGPDSMLLLDFMRHFARETGFNLELVHFNHHLRGTESDDDEFFVREYARTHKLDCVVSGSDVARVARERRRNLEATARELRHAFFFSLLRQGTLHTVATAHTANDQAETVLLRLVRGSGTRGLGGIHPLLRAAGGSVVRPFLELTRAEVEAEVARRSLPFRLDSSNKDARFRRNRVRNDLLPLLEREFNPHCVRALAGFADRAREDESLLGELARYRALPFLVRDEGELKIPCARLLEFPPAIARRVLCRMLREASSRPGSGSAFAPSASCTKYEIEALLRLAGAGQSGKRLLLPGGLEARREFEWLIAGRAARSTERRSGTKGFTAAVAPPCAVEVPELGLRLHLETGEIAGADQAEPRYTTLDLLWLDTDCLGKKLILRSWQSGDRLTPVGGAKPVKLSDYFQRQRVPLGERRNWPVLVIGGTIAWARGIGPAAGFERDQPCRLRLSIREERTGAQPVSPRGG
jgi:tRNA(Ile)-lysidine synthase